MAAQNYEGLFLLDPNKASADWEGAASQVNGVIERFGGQVLHTRPWGDIKLAYPIRKFKKGVYLLTYFTIDSTQLHEVEREYRISEIVLRRMIIRLDTRVAKDMLDHYTADHHEQPAEAAAVAVSA